MTTHFRERSCPLPSLTYSGPLPGPASRHPSPLPQPSGGRDARAVESCRWLGHHWLMPGTRSGEYAHLAVRPGGSRPDMEIEGGRVCVSRACEARWTRGDRPFSHLHHQVLGLHPPLAPPSSLLHPPPLASSPWKLLIALRQPGIGNLELSGLPASARALKGVMQRAPSHSLTQRDAPRTVLPRRSRPANPRSGTVHGAHPPAGQTARL